jgi:hypothetical protein
VPTLIIGAAQFFIGSCWTIKIWSDEDILAHNKQQVARGIADWKAEVEKRQVEVNRREGEMNRREGEIIRAVRTKDECDVKAAQVIIESKERK